MNFKKPYIVILRSLIVIIVIALIVLVNQKTKTLSPSLTVPLTTHLPLNKNGNFVLYVSNQSFALDPVDIKIYIDGKVAESQDFRVENQHNWQKFQFSLSRGIHKIHVESVKGEAKLEKKFEIKGKHWAVVDFWYYPKLDNNQTQKQFSFEIQDEPIMFM